MFSKHTFVLTIHQQSIIPQLGTTPFSSLFLSLTDRRATGQMAYRSHQMFTQKARNSWCLHVSPTDRSNPGPCRPVAKTTTFRFFQGQRWCVPNGIDNMGWLQFEVCQLLATQYPWQERQSFSLPGFRWKWQGQEWRKKFRPFSVPKPPDVNSERFSSVTSVRVEVQTDPAKQPT